MDKSNSFAKAAVDLILYDARVQIGVILLIIAIYTTLIGGFREQADNIAAALVTALVLDGLALKIKLKKWVWPRSAVVTGLLIGLILNPNFAIWQFVLVAATATASKYLILSGRKHIFNPASFGLVFSSLLFKGAITWWGVSWSSYISLFLFIAASFVLFRLHRLWLPVGFLIAYWLFLYFRGLFTLSLIADSVAALFAFVMLPEPQTSPIYSYFRYIFGVVVATFLIFYSLTFPNIAIDLFLLSLLSADLFTFTFLKIKST